MIQRHCKNIHNVKIKRLKIRHETKQKEWCVTQETLEENPEFLKPGKED